MGTSDKPVRERIADALRRRYGTKARWYPDGLMRDIAVDFEAALKAAVETHAASMVGVPMMSAFIQQAIEAGVRELEKGQNDG